MKTRRFCRNFICFLMSVCCLIIVVNRLKPLDSSWNDIYSRLHGPLSPSDERLVALVKEKYIDQPSELPYNLRMNKPDASSQHFSNLSTTHPSVMFLTEALKKFYPPEKKGKKGFFIEAGALDGEMGSTSLYLELKLGWTGFLVEPDSQMYKMLRSKNRKAASCNCCLSTKSYPFQTLLTIITQPNNHFDVPIGVYRGLNFLAETNQSDRIQLGYDSYEEVQCLPLETLLAALSVSRVDYFSLDVEGSELGILREFPWQRVTVDVFAVEHVFKNSNEEDEFIAWFRSKGYTLYKRRHSFPEDYIFVRNASSLLKNLQY